jgi:hypothetical protein
MVPVPGVERAIPPTQPTASAIALSPRSRLSSPTLSASRLLTKHKISILRLYNPFCDDKIALNFMVRQTLSHPCLSSEQLFVDSLTLQRLSFFTESQDEQGEDGSQTGVSLKGGL